MGKKLESIIIRMKEAESCVGRSKLKEFTLLMGYLKKIRKIMGKYESILFFIQPKGRNNIAIEKEFSIFLNNRKKKPEYCPTFTYPEIEKIDIKKIDYVVSKLDLVKKNAIRERFNCNELREVVLESLDVSRAKLIFLKELKRRNFQNAFEYCKIIYGDIDKDLQKKACLEYKKRIKALKRNEYKSPIEKELDATHFDAEKIRGYFKLALDQSGLGTRRHKIIIDSNVSSVAINEKDPAHNCPVILIPSKMTVSGLRLLQLIAHEIGKHATTNYYHSKEKLIVEMGKNWNAYSEGLAKKNENDITAAVLGKRHRNSELDLSVYYILAMGKIKSGCNFNKVYGYIFAKCYKEYLHIYQLDGMKAFDEECEILRKICIQKSLNSAKKVCLRVFRGFDPRKGSFYFTKDKNYFEGEILVRKINGIKGGGRLERYLYLAKVDAELIPMLIRYGKLDNKLDINKKKNIADYMWKNKIVRQNILNNKSA